MELWRRRIQETEERIGEMNTKAETRRSLLRRSNFGCEGRAGHGGGQKKRYFRDGNSRHRGKKE